MALYGIKLLLLQSYKFNQIKKTMTKSNSKSIKVVQFTHPGEEHSISQRQIKAGNMIKAWNNTKDHKRKFLHTTGAYVEKGKKTEEKDIYFWGEWEPDSEVSLIKNPAGKHYPHFIHEPFVQFDPSGQLIVPKREIIKDKNGKPKIKIPTNTDPFVFGKKGFYFSCCKQRSYKTLQKLEKGSLILFGSTINQNTDDAYFALDTVFVVGSNHDYNRESYLKKLEDFTPEHYCDIMNFKSWIGNLELTCYQSVNYASPIKGMYSFVPCKIGAEGENGFERVKLTKECFELITKDLEHSEYFQHKLNSAPKITESNIDDNIKIWTRLRKIIEKQGFKEAVRLDYKGEGE